MILIADSGSSRTEWCMLRPERSPLRLETQGLNPYFTTARQMTDIIDKDLAPFFYPSKITRVYFYGAGLGLSTNRDNVHQVLTDSFTNAAIEVNTDMLGAARALFGKKSGIACILGTGSNCCLYDGNEISHQPASLGYVLGDEGGGVHLGKLLLADFLRDKLPAELAEKLNTKYRFDKQTILGKIYMLPRPNAFIAGFAPFLSENLSHPYIRDMVGYSFRLFIENSIRMVPASEQYQVCFAGSVANAFREVLAEEFARAALNMGEIIQSPVEGLVKFHSA